MKIILLGIAFIIMAAGSACGVQSGAPVKAAPVQETATVSLQPTEDHQNNNPEEALLWEGPALFAEDQTECHRLRITQDNRVFIGLCAGEQTEVEFVAGGEGGWADMVSRFAPFQSDTPDEHIIFNGRGQIAGPAWERAITTWARFTYAELASGHIGAANRTVLAWNLGEQPDQPGQCRMLIVLAHGYATASLTPCAGGQMQVLAGGWVAPAEWEQFDTWLYSRAPFYQDNSYLDGRGTTAMNAEEAAALAAWAEDVYATLTKTR